jgi:hypothetical protein
MLRSSLAALAAILTLVALPPVAHSTDDAGYWAYADRIQVQLDATWDEHAGYYKLGGGGVEPMANSMLLLTHSVAAARGYDGPARNDHRARVLALRLVDGVPFVTKPGTGQTHAPGWVCSMTSGRGGQHLVFDAEVVDGLVYAYRARDALRLPRSTVAKIRSAIHRTARGSFWRYPAIRLNQVNWYALMYAADATVTGDPTLLRHDLALQLRRFFANARANFGPGMRFHYLPDHPPTVPSNVDSAEYANIVLSFVRFYDQARHAGMAPLPSSSVTLMHEWIERAIAGYWTHGGYMNWDTGLGFRRWHQTKKLGLAQEALVGLAASKSLLPSERWGQWAKAMLDRSLGFYDRQVVRSGGIPGGLLFGVHVIPQNADSARLGAARIEANAARAIDAGLGSQSAEEPPPLYSFDPDIGRLAVTTPTYNTAIVAVNQRAFPYGGHDLARLYDADQEVAANIGGRPPASFGAVVRDGNGRMVIASQTGHSRVTRATPLRLTKAPSGAGALASARAGRAFAGPFSDLRATGTMSSSALRLTVSHRFTRDWIQSSWTVARRAGTACYTAEVLFPSWGGRAATVVAVLRDGSRKTVGTQAIPLSSIAYLWVRSEFSGYVVVPASCTRGAAVHVLHPSPQSSAPKPGPTLAVRLARNARFSRVSLSVRLMPARSERQATTAAAS